MQPTIRLAIEQQEDQRLSSFAMRSTQTKGRVRAEEKCPMRTEYARDRDRIVHTSAFRRLKHKTQVFFSPKADHYRTRLTHTLEVAQIARTIARAINLNEDLVEAIAMGHDLGHTPFGHAGERALDAVTPFHFAHSAQSVRVVDKLERAGRGLNLTYEVRDGIAHHSMGGGDAHTLEGKVLEYADKIAYINHDIDDAVRAGILSPADLPPVAINTLGQTKSARITTMIHSIVVHSLNRPKIALDQTVLVAHEELRKFMFEQVYQHPFALRQEPKVFMVIEGLYNHFKTHQNSLPPHYLEAVEIEGIERVVCDYIAGMSDSFAVEQYQTLFIPKNFV